MAVKPADVTDVSQTTILAQDIQEFLAAEAVLQPTIMDFTSRVQKGDANVVIPRIGALAASDVPTNGVATDPGGASMNINGDTIDTGQFFREVPEFIHEDADLDSKVALKDAFLEAAPQVIAEDIESKLITELTACKDLSGGTAIQNAEDGGSGVNSAPSLANLRTGIKTLDDNKVPASDRWLIVNTEVKQHLIGKDDIQDASKAGMNTALVNGEFSNLYGARMIMSPLMPADLSILYHRTALAMAMSSNVEFIEEVIRREAREFLAVRVRWGTKCLDLGKRAVIFNDTGT